MEEKRAALILSRRPCRNYCDHFLRSLLHWWFIFTALPRSISLVPVLFWEFFFFLGGDFCGLLFWGNWIAVPQRIGQIYSIGGEKKGILICFSLWFWRISSFRRS